MRVFFTTTPRFKKTNNKNIQAIYEAIDSLGYKQSDEYLREVDLEEFYRLNKEGVPSYYDQILNSLKKADVVVFEGSTPSIGVGHLVNKALELGKGAIVLHIKDRFPFFLGGIRNKRLVITQYNFKNLNKILNKAFDKVAEYADVRFNFFVTPRILTYLDWISKKRKIPRAVYLRSLIEAEMKKNKEYQKEFK